MEAMAATETIQGYRVVRSFGGEGYERARFVKASTDNTKRQLKMVRTQETFSALMHLIVYSSMGLLLFTVLKVRGDASAGDVVAYITAAGLLPRAIQLLGGVSGPRRIGHEHAVDPVITKRGLDGADIPPDIPIPCQIDRVVRAPPFRQKQVGRLRTFRV